MKKHSILILAIIVLFTYTDAEAKYSGGNGDPNDPYQISTSEDLLVMAADINDYNKCFILTADIDLDPNLPCNYVFTTAVIAPDTNNLNLIFDGISFTGVFDGARHKIANLTIDTNGTRKDYLGLFGLINTDGHIKNISLQDVSVIGPNNSRYLGGLVGQNEGSISNCFSNGSITTGGCNSYNLGGLVGCNCAIISDCYSTGTVTGMYAWGLGGLVGKNDNYGSISDCYSTSNITSGRDGISACGVEELGGFVGRNNGSITNCYSTGTVTGKGWAGVLGGFVGYNHYGDISNCYSTGSVSGITLAGGLVGKYYAGSIISCYFLVTSGPDNGYGTPMTDAQMKQQSNFVGWDFTNETSNGTNDYWRMCVDGVEYPLLSWQFVPDFVCPDGVDILDLAFFTEKWLIACDETNNFCNCTDINYDEIVDFLDYTIFASYWLDGIEP